MPPEYKRGPGRPEELGRRQPDEEQPPYAKKLKMHNSNIFLIVYQLHFQTVTNLNIAIFVVEKTKKKVLVQEDANAPEQANATAPEEANATAP